MWTLKWDEWLAFKVSCESGSHYGLKDDRSCTLDQSSYENEDMNQEREMQEMGAPAQKIVCWVMVVVNPGRLCPGMQGNGADGAGQQG